MQMKTNKNGVKLLAAIAVFAMVAAALVVVLPASDAGVAPTDKYVETRDGPLNFAAKEFTVEGQTLDNIILGNQIEVAYDADSKTYVVTGILAKQDLSTESAFKTLWGGENCPSYGLAFNAKVGKSIQVGTGAVKETTGTDGCLLYIKETKTATVTIDKVEYSIDFTGVTLVDDVKNNPTGSNKYVIIPNSNALIGNTEGVDGNGGKWKYDNTTETLTLTNYNGKEYFDACDIAGNLSTIVLVGENTITLSGATIAICTENNLTIKSIDGVGSLTINMTVSEAAKAIEAGALSINGVSVTIDIVEDVEADAKAIETIGIDATSYDIYDATVKITVGEENYTDAIGLNAKNGDVSIRSAKVTIDAGNRAINAKGSVSIMASEVVATGSELGIRTYGINEADITITNSSKVTANALGLAEGFYTPYGISANDALIVQSDSVITTDGLIIYGLGTTDSTNNATIINDGDMMIWEEAIFENKAVLQNNGTIGIYGILTNSAGEITNNGTIQNYNLFRHGNITLTAEKEFKGVGATDKKDVTVKVAKISPQVDGTFIVIIETTTAAVAAEPTVEPTAETEPSKRTFQGVMTAAWNGTTWTYAINAMNDDGVFNLAYNGEKFNIYISEDDVVGNDIEDKSDELGQTLFKTIESEITVTGGKLANSSKIVINDVTALVAGGELVNSGDMAFNANVTISSGKISGNDVPIANGVTVKLTGTVDMVFTNSGSYTDRPAGATSDTTVQYSDAIQVTGTPNGTQITAPKNSDKGVMTISVPNSDSKKAAQITILKGDAKTSSDIGLNMTLLVATGTSLTISGTVKVTDGVIGVQDGATINMKISGNKDTVSYGTLNYVISFANEGYTYYGSLQFALANAAEGATLNLNSEARINVDTVVKKGITLAFAENAKLNIADAATEAITVSMEEGAKFVLAKGASIVITGEKATISGNVVYDVNEIVLDKVVFTSNATISASVATKTDASAVKIIDGSNAVTANNGKITVVSGNATGKLTLVAVMENEKLKTTANLAVSAGAVSKIALTDNYYTETVIGGTLTSADDIEFLGAVSGNGAILLADGKKVTFTYDVVDIAVTNGTDSIVLDKVSGRYFDDDGKYQVGKSTILNIQSFAKTSTKAAYLGVFGGMLSGTITANGNAAIGISGNIFELGTDAVMIVPAGSTATVTKYNADDTKKNTIVGLLKVAGTINMYDADDSDTKSYGKLNYQITYTDGEYTVYTMLNTGVNNAKEGDSFTVTGVITINNTDDPMIIPAGVTITIDEDAVFTIDNNYVVIGTPITSLGAGNSAIIGKVILTNEAFLIAYNDGNIDLSKTKIVNELDSAAKNSQYNMLNEIYATVYIASTATLAVDLVNQQEAVEKVLVPNIDGYRFLGWEPLVEDKKIGQTDFDANMKANMVQITFQKADGISYYVDNEKMNIIGAPVYVAYGATITAVADSGYTGTPLVNGKTYLSVDNTFKTVVGSGVSPAVDPTPEPEPEKKDDGMGLTDILLIVLVILAAILVIVVAIRMMRS